MRFEQKTIYVDSVHLADLLNECRLMMTKENRIVYLTDARQITEALITNFVYAHEGPVEGMHDRYILLRASFLTVLTRARRIVNEGALTSPHPFTHRKVRTMRNELVDTLGRIDEALRKWERKIIVRGKTAAA